MHDPEDEAVSSDEVQGALAEVTWTAGPQWMVDDGDRGDDEETPGDPLATTYWQQPQVLLWICTRDPDLVAKAAGVDQSELIFQVGFSGCERSWSSAEAELINQLGSGALRAWGLRNGTGDLELIPEVQWAHLAFHIENDDRIPHAAPRDQRPPNCTFWTCLKFKRADALALWPDPLEAPFDSEQTSSVGEAVKAKYPRGYAHLDQTLMPEMKPLIDRGKSLWAAAMELAPRAAGSNTTLESKTKRLCRRYQQWASVPENVPPKRETG